MQKIVAQVQDDQHDDENNTARTTTKFNEALEVEQKAYLANLIASFCNCLRWKYNVLLPIRKAAKYSPFMPKQPFKVPDQVGRNIGKKTLVLDLDETLVHSSFSPVPDPDLQFNLQLDGQLYTVYVRVRPGAYEFIKLLSNDYEIIIYTASISEYADPVIDYLDPEGVVSVRLFRENCTLFKNIFVKDLANLNREISNLIIVDNSPNSFMFQPMNAFQIRNFFDDMNDQELYYLIPFFKLLKDFQDVRPVHEWWYKFVNFEQFQFTNTLGQKVIYIMKEELDEDELDVREHQTNRKQISQINEQNRPTMSKQTDVPDSNIDSPKGEEIISLVKKYKQKSIIVPRNREFMSELDERMGLSTEGNEVSTSKSRRRDESNPDSALRSELNINSPKEALQKKMIFPEPQNERSQQEQSSY